MIAYLKFKFGPNRRTPHPSAGPGPANFQAPAPINRRKVTLHVSDASSGEPVVINGVANQAAVDVELDQLQSELKLADINRNPFEVVQLSKSHVTGNLDEEDEGFQPVETQPLNRSRTLPSATEARGAFNQLEDLALTQTMFENGTLICHGEAEAFVNIIRTNRNSINNMDSQEVRNYLQNYPELLQDEEEEKEVDQNGLLPDLKVVGAKVSAAALENDAYQTEALQEPSFRQKLFSKLSGNDGSRPNKFMNAIGNVFLGREVEAGDAGATPITDNVRARLNSDGFLEVTTEEEKELEQIASSKATVLNNDVKPCAVLTMPMRIEIENDYIMTSHLGDWEKLYHEYTFSGEQMTWHLKSEHPDAFRQIAEAVQKRSLSNGQSRQLAWSLLMGICSANVQACYSDLYAGYLSDAFDLDKSTISDFKVQKQISLDVHRTFSTARIPGFIAPVESRQNCLYNVLAAFAKHCPEVGYCQGMNFLCALILIGVDFNEVSAFVMLEKLLGEYGQLATLYDGKLAKVFSLSDHVYSWLLEEEPELEELVSNHGVPLTTLFAGPLMAVFSNIFEDTETCLAILDRLILQKEAALVGIIKHVYRNMKTELLKYRQVMSQSSEDGGVSQCGDSSQLQAYLVRLIYIDAEQRGLLFPQITASQC